MTGMPDEEIQLGLKFLCCPDNNILKIFNKKIPAAFHDEDKIWVVDSFDHENVRVDFIPK
jgi:hypothetical protein